MIIQCEEILEHTPGNTPPGSPQMISNKKRPTAPVSRCNSSTSENGGDKSVFCDKCKERHPDIFSCPKVLGGVLTMAMECAPESAHDADKNNKKKALVPPPSSKSIGNTEKLPAPQIADNSSHPLPPLPPISQAPKPSNVSVGGNDQYPRLSQMFGADKFQTLQQALSQCFESEDDLMDYAGTYLAANQIDALKAALVTDANLTPIQAVKLIGKLSQLHQNT
jgi:hypothetical protein